MSAYRPCVSKLPLALFTFIILLNSPSCALDQRLTANQVAARIQSHVGIPWMVGTADLSKRLATGVIRVVGDPNIKFTKVALAPGATGFANETRALESDDVETLVVGETIEWETGEYVADAVTEVKRKALIVLGHVPSEQARMEECARWLKTFITEAPIEFIPTRDPFWSPKIAPGK
jgi:putative NIF3 family GTP cyclohydrolase 1 type 2